MTSTSPKIQPELLRRIAALSQLRREVEEVNVLVTLAPGMDLEALRRRGMRVDRLFGRINVAAGAARAIDVHELARESGVLTIELDSEMHALGS